MGMRKKRGSGSKDPAMHVQTCHKEVHYFVHLLKDFSSRLEVYTSKGSREKTKPTFKENYKYF